MNTSPTQIETYQLCARKWWFLYVLKIKLPKADQFVFGTVLHAACERFLTGKPLWPDGWDFDPESKKRVTPSEGALIQVLVQAGIDAGYLETRPGGEVEQWMSLSWEDMTIRGLQDYRTSTRVEDHKSSKSERYMKSSEGLKTTLQMMIYIKERLEKFRASGKMPPPVFEIAHNQFKKDFEAPLVRRREAEVSPAEIDAFWDGTVVPLLRGMRKDREEKDPFNLPDPPKKSCRAFAGCEFQGVCGGAEHYLTFQKRMTTLMTSNQQETRPMTTSPKDFLAKRGAGAPPAGTPAINPPAPEKKAGPSAAASAANEDFVPPPWAAPDCPLCGKGKGPYSGFNMTTGKPCRICPTKSKVAVSEKWEFIDGVPVWYRDGEQVAQGPVPGAGKDSGSKTAYSASDLCSQMRNAKTVEECDAILLIGEEIGMEEVDAEVLGKLYNEQCAMLEIQNKKPSPTPAVVAPAAEEPKPRRTRQAAPKREDPPPSEQKTETSETEGSSTGGLVLMIGCAPLKWDGENVLFAEDFLLNAFEGYWQNTAAFERRERLRRAILEEGDRFRSTNAVIIQQGRDPDIDNLMSALIPFASKVIRGTIQ